MTRTPRPRGLSLREAFLWFVDGPPPESASEVWKWNGTTQNGYGILCFGGRNLKAYRVSYELFVGPIPDGMSVRHRNDTPIDVNPLNLEIGTLIDNRQDCLDRNRQARGERQHLAKLTDESVSLIRRRHAEGEPLRGLAREFGVTRSTLQFVVSGKTWKHVPFPEVAA